MKLESYLNKSLTPAEIQLCKIYERREDAYKAAEEKRRKELQLVNESIASMINPVLASGEKEVNNDEEPDQEGCKEEEVTAPVKEIIQHDPAKYKDYSKQAALASEQLKEKLAAKTQSKRKYEITSAPEDHRVAQDKEKADGGIKRLKKKTTAEEEEDLNIVDTEKVSSMLDPSNYIAQEPWDPKTALESITFPLEKFGVNEEDEEAPDEEEEEEDTLLKYAQTVVLSLTVPRGARRWSLNICPQDHKNLSDVFLHVNPRYKKSKLHLNDKQGTWGKPQESPMTRGSKGGSGKKNRGDGLLSSEVELVISITKKAFCIYANGVCAAIFPHRRDLRKHSVLSLVLGRSDDNGVLEDVVFNSVWWGYLSPRVNYNKLMSKEQKEFMSTLLTFEARQKEKEERLLADEAEESGGGVVVEEPSERTLEVWGLPPHTDPKEIQHVEEALYSVFDEYNPEDVQIASGVGRGYARFPSLELCLDALQNLQGAGLEFEGVAYYMELKRLENFA